jgi:hypothetical protein
MDINAINETNYSMFHQIPTAPGYSINKLGEVIDNKVELNPIVKHRFNNGEPQPVVSLKINNKWSAKRVSRLMMDTFLVIPEELKNIDKNQLVVAHKDNDFTNLNYDNLEIISKAEASRRYALDQGRINKEKFSIPDWSQIENPYYPNAIECTHKPGYYYIPNNNGFLVINKQGQIWDLVKNEVGNTHLDADGITKVSINTTSQGSTHVYIHKTLAMMFMPIPDELKETPVIQLVVSFKDGDKLNLNIDNLYWNTKLNNIKNSIIINKIKFKVPDWNITNGYYPNAIECEFKPGYYYIPDTNRFLVINKKGNLFELVKNKKLIPYMDYAGYYKFSLSSNENESKSVFVHRIVAMLFCPIPKHHHGKKFDELMINHRDGIKINNYHTNLEWCNNEENINHAYNTNLNNCSSYVFGRNIITNKITIFRSIKEAAKYLNVGDTSLHAHLHSDSSGKIIKKDMVFKFDKYDWPEVIFKQSPNIELGAGGLLTVAIHPHTKSKSLYNNLRDACNDIGLNYDVIKKAKTEYGYKCNKTGFILTKLIN